MKPCRFAAHVNKCGNMGGNKMSNKLIKNRDELWVVVNIGCIECGVSSNIVGVFDSKDYAEKVAEECFNKYSWREEGQNAFEVFKLPSINVINAEYNIQL